ncbi:MAG: hypothetical protein E7596_06090 [Ruminococcaceae bacterium]|nr:hypothetical protein [Oscillospiraceae bacterium]
MSKIRYDSFQKELLERAIKDEKHLSGYYDFYSETNRYSNVVNSFMSELEWTLNKIKGEIAYCQGEIKLKKDQIDHFNSRINEESKKLKSEDKEARSKAKSSISYISEEMGEYQHQLEQLKARLNVLQDVFPKIERAYFEYYKYVSLVSDFNREVLFDIDRFKGCCEEPLRDIKNAGICMENYAEERSTGDSIFYIKISPID